MLPLIPLEALALVAIVVFRSLDLAAIIRRSFMYAKVGVLL